MATVASVPKRRRALGWARRGWHEFTRMRTAIYFLIAIIIVIIIGGIVPQQNTDAQPLVTGFLTSHQHLDAVATAIGLPLTQVYTAPLFLGLIGCLYVSLGWCVLRRGRALVVRTFKRYPKTAQYWGEWGSWLFHASFFLILVAAVWGKATGFDGLMTITQGQTVVEAPASYDTLTQGILSGGWHSDLRLTLDKFVAAYGPSGQASDYASTMTVTGPGRAPVTSVIRVNHYLAIDGLHIYQQDYGWAPTIKVTNPSGTVVFDSPVQCFGEDKSDETCVLKVPDFNYTVPGARQPLQIGAEMVMLPGARPVVPITATGALNVVGTTYIPGSGTATNPVIGMQLFVGNLGLGSGQPQNVNSLDVRAMEPYFANGQSVFVPLGKSLTLDLPGADGAEVPFTISFPSLVPYSLFQISKDSGVPLIYAAFTCIMAGILIKLYLTPLLVKREKERAARRRDRARRPGGPGQPPDEAGDGPPVDVAARSAEGERYVTAGSSG